ncbi:hypothetical protein KEM52_000475 [Ascosphaera acerosa]|nr:hypothetical protein KEM52_000475 [Ascosphaera acerosa]
MLKPMTEEKRFAMPSAKQRMMHTAPLRELKALKLRGAGLRDAEAQVLACAVGRRLRLLDVSGNRLTEAGWAWLLQRCFRRGRASAGGSTGDASRNKHDVHSATLHDDIDCEPDYYYEWSASPSPHANRLTARSLRSAHLERDLRLQLSEPLTGRSSFADHIPWTGITHVAVGENSPPISPAMLATLVSAGGLYSLDVGPAAASLASGLFEFPGAKTLRYLRVHFDAIVDTRISEGDECHAVPRAGEWCYTPPSIDKLLQRRPQLHGPASLQPPLLHPSWLPRLETLVLTSVPRRSPQPQSRVLVNALGHFITACGDEATLSQISSREASSTAHRHPHDYASPPRPFPFSLRRIVLETTESDGHVFVSSTEDPDSERLWRQAAGDFSFFRDEAVYSAPGLSPSSSLPPGQPYARDGVEAGRGLAQPLVDTVAELAAWRRAKREEYARAAQQARADGLHRLYVKGYWAGEVSVVRAAAGGR